MICPRCKRDAKTLWGNGDYPNDSYRCSQCCDDDTGKVVFWMCGVPVIIYAVIVVVGLIRELL